MTSKERTILILVLAILAACGLVTLVSPEPTEPEARTGPEKTLIPTTSSTLVPMLSSTRANTPVSTPTPAPTRTPTAAPTFASASTPASTSTSVPPTAAATSTPRPSETPAPTDAPPAATSTTVAAETPLPTGTPAAASPLAMDWMLVQKGCVSDAQWVVEVWLTAEGGTGEYTFYRDTERLYGPARVHGFAYRMFAGTGSAAEGIFGVESGAQRVRSEFWIERLDCGQQALPPTPVDSTASGASVSPLEPGSSP